MNLSNTSNEPNNDFDWDDFDWDVFDQILSRAHGSSISSVLDRIVSKPVITTFGSIEDKIYQAGLENSKTIFGSYVVNMINKVRNDNYYVVYHELMWNGEKTHYSILTLFETHEEAVEFIMTL